MEHEIPFARLRSVLVVVLFLLSGAVHGAGVGGSVFVQANAGACTDSTLLPASAPPDVLVHRAVSCGGVSASADARVEESTGSVGLRVAANSIGAGESQATAQVLYSDTWTITGAGVPVGGSLTIPVTFLLHGVISPDAAPAGAIVSLLDYGFSIRDSFSVPLAPFSFAAGGSLTTAFTGTLALPGSVTLVNRGAALPMAAVVSVSLFAQGIKQGNVDFFNTASVFLDLPAGVAAVSSAGTPVSFVIVPLPAAAILMLVGLGTLRVVGRRRTSQRYAGWLEGVRTGTCRMTRASAKPG